MKLYMILIEDPWDEYNEFKFHSLWSNQQVAEKVAHQVKGETAIEEVEVDPKECPIRHFAEYAAFTVRSEKYKREEIYFSPVIE